MPFCVRNYELLDDNGQVVYKKEGNYQTRNTLHFAKPLVVKNLTLLLQVPVEHVPAALFEMRCYG